MTINEQKATEFMVILKDIENLNGAFILENSTEYQYITFVYDGKLYYIQASICYPFTDKNNPGAWNFMVSSIDGINTKSQHTYFHAYKGVDSLKSYQWYNIPLTSGQKINCLLNNYERIVKQVIVKDGGNCEKEIIKNGAFMVKCETWNNEHKIIEVLSIMPESDGYRDGFQVDCVTGNILRVR